MDSLEAKSIYTGVWDIATRNNIACQVERFIANITECINYNTLNTQGKFKGHDWK